MVALFNACLRLAYFPQKWRKATVIVIPKQGEDFSRPDNLWPTSLLSATSKVLERLIQRRVLDHLRNFDVPVSYTHLDVYKRQGLQCTSSTKMDYKVQITCNKQNISGTMRAFWREVKPPSRGIKKKENVKLEKCNGENIVILTAARQTSALGTSREITVNTWRPRVT